MEYSTADLSDQHPEKVRVADPIFKTYGAKTSFAGQIETVKVFEDNVLVKTLLNQPGQGKVLVVDGGGSLRCALVGDLIAKAAVDNGWEGVVVYGCIRDSATIANIAIGIKALNTHPLKSIKYGHGTQHIPVTFAGVTFYPEHYLYSDADGIIVSETALI